MTEVSILDQNTVVCFSIILRSGVVFTLEVRMKHVDKCWKDYPVGNNEESPECECEVEKC